MADNKAQPYEEYYQPQVSTEFEDVPPPPYDEQQSVQQTPASAYLPPLPPRRIANNFGDDDPSNPIHYARDPHKLIAYLVPFPKPKLKDVPPEKIPDRFLIYTPPPPPLVKPAEGEKEERLHKVQRKWQEEVREAKNYSGEAVSWKGFKSRATRGINWAISQTTSANLDFVNRLSGDVGKAEKDKHADDGVQEDATTKKTVGINEMILVYPLSMSGDPASMRVEFVNSMLRTKSKAQRDAVLATGLLPVTFAIDILATLVWPFGGLVEIDAVWAYSSIRGAKIARGTTKRLASSGDGDGAHVKDSDAQIHLDFKASPRLEILRKYLASVCHRRNSGLFPVAGPSPTETEVLEAIGWSPRQTGGESRNWEDELWEVAEVKEDFKAVMTKGSREWDKWCRAFEKDPEKALKR
ncbi:uncharacterized protein K452DRAFT_286422 [Aplosporella prunicola CBS 121167]|uniref:Secreted protein n=1 Tax=Aplosporella prunicola CBS 121167 TaxID=1176127 RepID=A0A6A6BH74_9PEZI|nr:uncharacterized protein K452DRAFT_286422 [Aplosporella prunicola CBS 121167]KAF2142793.1 hypothetical protein K452DRAFT_286422 [Aplosporella prunicola CBS 121167]